MDKRTGNSPKDTRKKKKAKKRILSLMMCSERSLRKCLSC